MLIITIIQQIVQDFAKECNDPLRGARVKGMPARIETRTVLVNILTSIIFVCGPLHSTINFAQYEYMAFIPNMPFAIYKDIQLLADQEAPITERQLMQVTYSPQTLRCLDQSNRAALRWVHSPVQNVARE
jgi:hypothetical protein